jgi:hypothetical protein
MKSGRLFAVVVIADVLLAGCSGTETPGPSSSQQSSAQQSSTQAVRPAAMLDGVYRLDFDLQRQLRNGVPDPGKPFSQLYAFRSVCDGDTCIAVGRRLRDDAPTQPAEQPAVVLDFVKGEWVSTVSGKNPCGGGQSPVLQSWSLKPGDGGVMKGTRRLAFFSLECGSAYEQPMTATRTGDVDPGLAMPDPAKEPPLKEVTAEGFRGRYNKSLTAKDGQKAPDVQVDVSTTCVRNALHCLTYAVYSTPGGKDRSVRAYEFQGKTWTGQVRLLTNCTSGAGVIETTYSEWLLPDPATNPFPRLTGTQREVYPQPCVGAVVSDVVMVRIGE